MAIKDLISVKKCLFICNGGSCMRETTADFTAMLRNEIKLNNLEEEFHTIRTKCMGRCEDGPVMMCSPDNTWFKHLTEQSISLLIREIAQGQAQNNKHFLYAFGDDNIQSNSIPTNNRTK